MPQLPPVAPASASPNNPQTQSDTHPKKLFLTRATKASKAPIRALSNDKLNALEETPSDKRRRTSVNPRHHIATLFISGYLILIFLILLPWVLCGDHTIDSVDKLINTIGTLLGSPLGFIIGYYYKDKAK